MKGGDAWSDSVILHKDHIDRLGLELAQRSDNGIIKRREFHCKQLIDQVLRMQMMGHEKECCLAIALLVLHTAEPEMRNAIRIKRTRGVGNIPHNIKRIHSYLSKTINGNSKGEEMKMSLTNAKKITEEAMQPLRDKFGYRNPVTPGNLYYLTDDVRKIAETEPKLLTALEDSYNWPLSSHQLEKLGQLLQNRFPKNAANVMEVIRESALKEQYSMLSISKISGGQAVTIVSEDGDDVTLESWKLIQLISNPNEAMVLHRYPTGYAPDASTVFKFNFATKGTVVGKLSSETSRLYLAVLDDNSGDTIERAEFLIDTDYLLCLWIVLSRLQADDFLFNEWRRSAESRVKTDPFVEQYYREQEARYVH